MHHPPRQSCPGQCACSYSVFWSCSDLHDELWRPKRILTAPAHSWLPLSSLKLRFEIFLSSTSSPTIATTSLTKLSSYCSACPLRKRCQREGISWQTCSGRRTGTSCFRLPSGGPCQDDTPTLATHRTGRDRDTEGRHSC